MAVVIVKAASNNFLQIWLLNGKLKLMPKDKLKVKSLEFRVKNFYVEIARNLLESNSRWI